MLLSFGSNENKQCGINDVNIPTEIKETSYFVNKIEKVVCSDNRTIILDDEGKVSIIGDISIFPEGMVEVVRGTETNSRRYRLNFKKEFENDDVDEFDEILDIASTSTTLMFICSLGNIYQIQEKTMSPVHFFKESYLKEKFLKISAGIHHFVFKTKSNKIFSIYGTKESMGLGNNDSFPTDLIVHSPLPAEIDGKLEIKKIVCGLNHTIVLAQDGTVYCTGENNKGQLGMGSNNHPLVSSFTQIHTEYFENKEIIDVATGDFFTIFLDVDQRVLVVGENSSNQLGFEWQTDAVEYIIKPLKPITFNNQTITHVYASGNRSFFKSSQGVFWACGQNDNGQLGVTSEITEPQEIILPLNYTVDKFAISRKHSFMISLTSLESASDISVSNSEESRLLNTNRNLMRENKKMKKDLDRLNSKQKEYVKTNVSLKYEVNALRKKIRELTKENEQFKDLMDQRHVNRIEDQMVRFQAQSQEAMKRLQEESEATMKSFQEQMQATFKTYSEKNNETMKSYSEESDATFNDIKDSVDEVRENRKNYLEKWKKDHQTREDIYSQRGKIVHELLENDKRFARDMKKFVDEFIHPFKKEYPNQFPDCFGKITAMESLASHLADQLSQTLYEWYIEKESQPEMELKLAEYYMTMSHALKLFIDYIAVIPKIQKLSLENKTIKEFIESTEARLKASSKDAHDKFKFNSFCIQPTQQSVQYTMFINRLIDLMDADDPLQEMIKAKEALRDIGFYNNRLLDELEKTRLITDLRNTLGPGYDLENSELKIYEPKCHRHGIAIDQAGVSFTANDPKYHSGDHIPCKLYILSNMIIIMDSHHHLPVKKKKNKIAKQLLLKANGDRRMSISLAKKYSNVPNCKIVIPVSNILNFVQETEFEFKLSYSHSNDTITSTQTITVPHRGTVDCISEMISVYDHPITSSTNITPSKLPSTLPIVNKRSSLNLRSGDDQEVVPINEDISNLDDNPIHDEEDVNPIHEEEDVNPIHEEDVIVTPSKLTVNVSDDDNHPSHDQNQLKISPFNRALPPTPKVDTSSPPSDDDDEKVEKINE